MGKEVVDAAIRIYSDLGPGLLEPVYEVVLANELESRGLAVERQVKVSTNYRGITSDDGFRADILIESKVILELKSLEQMNKVHYKQLLTYLRLRRMKLGFLLNLAQT